ncbi:MAG: hypothetical protein IJF17_02200 [Thermoguttaceae bacterium]|nr:hypothetical protein [Thermoguttaceae bacterium]
MLDKLSGSGYAETRRRILAKVKASFEMMKSGRILQCSRFCSREKEKTP